ncbi:MAG: aminoacyl-tRNA hydrolase [Pirellulaceae bacterium]
MKLITGLGNPGSKYRDTRHNVGFRVIAELHQRLGQARPSSKFESEFVQVVIGEHKVLLQSPLTFMNLSGRAVRGLMDFYKIPASELLVVCDDFNLTLGRLRFRPGGSAGGQNGLKDIIQQLGTQEIARLRLGVGLPPEDRDVSSYVLSKFRPEEHSDVDKAIQRAADGALVWVEHGVQECMNRFNADPNKPPKPRKKTQDESKAGDKGAEDDSDDLERPQKPGSQSGGNAPGAPI